MRIRQINSTADLPSQAELYFKDQELKDRETMEFRIKLTFGTAFQKSFMRGLIENFLCAVKQNFEQRHRSNKMEITEADYLDEEKLTTDQQLALAAAVGVANEDNGLL